MTSFQIVSGIEADDIVAEPDPVPVYPPEGTVESIGNANGFTVSSPQEIVPRTFVTTEPYGICYWTQNGTYIFNKTTPEKMSLVSLNRTRAISEAFFTVEASSDLLITANATIQKMTDDFFQVDFSLLDPNSQSAVGKMSVTFEFFAMKAPKITAIVDSLDVKSSWHVVWIVVPMNHATLDSDDPKGSDVSLTHLIGAKLSSRSHVYLNIGGDGLALDWSDAGIGDLEIAEVKTEQGNDPYFKVRFSERMAVIDPTTVTSSTNADPTGYSSQRKLAWYGGYFWLFYNSGTTVCYRNSIDGITWSGEVSLPEGTTPTSRAGFDVAVKNGYVLVGWFDTGGNLMIKKGMIVGSAIVWSNRCNLNSYLYDGEEVFLGNTVSVAIGSDNTFWISQGRWDLLIDGYAYICAFCCPSDGWGTFSRMMNYNVMSMFQCDKSVFMLLPCPNGNMALLEAGCDYGYTGYNGYIRVFRYWSSMNTWSSSDALNIGVSEGSSPGYSMNRISAVASENGVVHIGFVSGAYIKYANVTVSGTLSSIVTLQQYAENPSICLDENGDLRIFYAIIPYSPPLYHIRYNTKEKNSGTWSTSTDIHTNTFTNPPKGLTTWTNPAGVMCLAWAEDSGSSKSLLFASVPLPFGTPGAAADPWNRDGLSPYGTYFSANGDYVSPGSGQLTVLQQDVSVPGRNGVDLTASRIYQQPRYFDKDSGNEYGYKAYPFCSMGRYWSLDLPWMDQNYVYVSNGQRFVIQWGNEGNIKEFVNHDGIHFTLRDVTKSGRSYFELITSSGMRYEFDHGSPYKLVLISDLQGFNPTSSTYTLPLNRLTLSYSGNNLATITDSALGRSITFSYTSDGTNRLNRITAPDGTYSTFAYTTYGSYTYLTSVTDPDSRVTTFTYASSSDYCLSSIQYPTGGKVMYSYAVDNTPATEYRSWLVTSEAVRNTATNVLIRQASFDYKVANGKVSMATQTDYDESGLVQGYTKYVFQSVLGCQDIITLNTTGSQMQRSRTWFDFRGQPVRVDSYLGDSTSVNYSTYTGYDNWGNLIYSRDALGHESYLSYANTSTQNSFQGSCVLTRTSSGLVFYEAFDNWDWSSWVRDMGDGYNALDSSLDAAHSPAMRITRTGSGGEAKLEHTFAAQGSDFIIQTSLMANLVSESKMQVLAGTTERIAVRLYGGYFGYYNTGNQWVNVAPCVANQWYDLALYVHPSTNTFDIYIDGSSVINGLSMRNSGNIDRLNFQSRYSSGNTLWFDNVRVYKGLTVTVNGLGSGYVLEMFDSRNTLIARSKTGTIVIPSMPLFAPPAYLSISKIGDRSYSTPLMDIWGGDIYTIDFGLYSTALIKTSYGFGGYTDVMEDESGVPSGATYYYAPWDSNGNHWITDPNYAASGNSYHKSFFVTGIGASWSHYYGWQLPSSSPLYMHIDNSADAIVQYIWLEDGKIPQEIVLQYYVGGTWKRAFWGGDSMNQDIIFMMSPLNNPSMRYRVGDVPQITGRWLQLTVKASSLGINSGADIYGIVYGVYGGVARWDLSSTNTMGVQINGLTSGMVVKMKLDNGTVISQTASGASMVLDLYSRGIVTFPVAGTFEVYTSGGTLLYASPRYPEIYNGDGFQYSTSAYYPNVVKDGFHNTPVGIKSYQDYAETVSQEIYYKYNNEGNAVLIKTKMGTGWVYSSNTYDSYGNVLSTMDESGSVTCYDYSNSNGNTYPVATHSGGRTDIFESDTSWQSSRTSANGNVAWLTAGYSTARSYSPSNSLLVSFNNGPTGYDTGKAVMYKEFYTNSVSSISLKMYCSAYTRATGNGINAMDSGLRMKLYDANGVNYATYTYWLACWDQSTNNRTAPDASTKVIYGQPTMNTWKNPTFNPNVDFTIDWTNCDKVRFELYVNGTGTSGDIITLNFDDFNYDDTPIFGIVPETFESDTSWTASKSSSNGNVAWLTADYVTTRSYSPTHSLQISFTSGPSGYDTGVATMYKDYVMDSVSSISLRMYCSAYSHDRRQWDTMDTGVRMRLYDSSNNNYATYTYWLAAWYLGTNNKTAPDANTKVIYGQPAMNTWLNPVLNPNSDFLIDWTNCEKVRFELYVYGSGTNADAITMHYDDLIVNGESSSGPLGLTSFAYDNRNGRLLSTMDPLGHVTSSQYDVLGRVVRSNNSDGTYTTAQYDDAANKVTAFDELSHKTVSYYDEIGRLKKVERYGLASTVYSYQTYTYTWQDKVKTATDEVGRVTKYYYDYLGRPTVTRYMNGTSSSTSTSDNFESGAGWTANKYASTSPTWLTAQYSTSLSYSPTRSLQLSFSNGPPSYDTGGASMSREYKTTQISSVSLRMYCDVYQHTGGTWDTMDSGLRLRLYDANGVNYATYTYWFACWYQSTNTKTVPDANTKLIYSQPTLDTWLNPTLNPSTDFSIDWTSCDKVKFEFYTYGSGAAGDTIAIYYDDFSFTGVNTAYTETKTVYDDKNARVTRIDENGNKVVSVLDYLGRLNATREYCSPTAFYQTSMTYDAVGNLKTVRAANGEVTRMYYNGLNQETSIIYPDSRSESWTYNYVGQVIAHTDRSGVQTTIAYDTAGREIRAIGSSDRYYTKYDAEGQVVFRKNNLGSISYQYNNRDMVSRVTEVISGTSYSFTYGYDAAGKVTSVGYPDSSAITYVYDNYDRVSQVKIGNNQLLSLTYNLDDTLASKNECNDNSTMTYTYNNRGWTSSIIARSRNNNVFMSLGYTYDNAGNVKSIISAVGSAGTETYNYDALDRLTQATGAWGTIRYGYDSMGNRLWINDGTNRSYTYTTYNKLTSDGTWSYAYDRNGNVIWKNSTTARFHYIYNSFGQMISVESQTYSGGSWSALTTVGAYYYDANGARARTVEGSTTNNFVYQGIDTMCQFSSDGKTNKYVYAAGQLQLRTCSAAESYAYITDALGSTRFVLKNGNKDATNTVFSAVTYKPFGGAVTTTGSDRITYAGETTDSPTGLVYLSARYMDPAIGRFYALDPELGSLSMPQTLNRYVYCANSPLIHTDPTGRFWNIVAGAIAGTIIGTAVAIASGGDLNQIAASAAAGFVGGAITGATFGLAAAAATIPGAVGILAVGGAASSVAGDVVSNAIQGRENDWGKIAENALFSAGTNIVFAGAGGVAKQGLLGSAINPGKWNNALKQIKPINMADKAMGKMPFFNKAPMLKYSGDSSAITKAVSMLNHEAFHQPLTASGIIWGIGRGAERTAMLKGSQAYAHNAYDSVRGYMS